MRKIDIEEILARLAEGYYPFFDRENNVFYWDRELERAIIPLSEVTIEKAQYLESRVQVDFDVAFGNEEERELVLRELQKDDLDRVTWVRGEVVSIYRALCEHDYGFVVLARDVRGDIVGGILGIRLGQAVLLETMFSRAAEASKICLCRLVQWLQGDQVVLLDVQVPHPSDHPVHRLGEEVVSLDRYLKMLHEAAGDNLLASGSDFREIRLSRGISKDWNRATPTVVRTNEQESTLLINGFQVMQSWETELMHEMARAAAKEKSRVLEIGYGLGISAKKIQEFNPDLHVVIESNHYIANIARCELGSDQKPDRIVVVENDWQAALKNRDLRKIFERKFDGILFDTYPVTKEELRAAHFDFFNSAASMLANGGTFTYFSDESASLSIEHRARIEKAFPNHEVHTKVVKVTPSANCEYWDEDTILHVEITASN